MKQERIAAVKGNQIFAGGRWLTAIGNKTMRPSDIVWTDGCCVYGDQSEGGSAPVIVSEGCIPIFWQNGQHQLYQRHKLRDGILGTPHHRMVNRGSHVTFSDDPACLDVSIGRDGKTYLVKSGSYELPSEVYEGQAGVSGDGKMVMSLDLKDYIEAGQAYALREIGKLDTPLPYGPETLGYGEHTVIHTSRCELSSGWYESASSYCLFIDAFASVTYMEGLNWHNGDGSPGWEEADIAYWIDLDGTLQLMVTPGGRAILRGSYYLDKDYHGLVHDSNLAATVSIPLPDGYSITMTRREQDYVYALRSTTGQEICGLPQYSLGMSVSACKLPGQSWLVGMGRTLYRSRKGTLEQVGGYDLGNCRLRPTRNRRMKGDL